MCECFSFFFFLSSHTKYSYTISLSTNLLNKSLIKTEEEKKMILKLFLLFVYKLQAIEINSLLVLKLGYLRKINFLHSYIKAIERKKN